MKTGSNYIYQIFRRGTYTGGHDQSDFLFAIADGILLQYNRFWKSVKMDISTIMRCA